MAHAEAEKIVLVQFINN